MYKPACGATVTSGCLAYTGAALPVNRAVAIASALLFVGIALRLAAARGSAVCDGRCAQGCGGHEEEER